MKIAIVFFTYEADADLLRYAVQAVTRLRRRNPADEFSVFVRDDACAPLAVVPGGVDYAQTSFDRCRNLNGAECIAGMLAEYRSILERGYDWLIKADCDTVINDVEWLRERDPEHVAHVGTCHVDNYSSGACYAMGLAGVKSIQEFMQSATVLRRVQRAYCEDRAFCAMSGICGHAEVMDNKKNALAPGLLYHDWLNDYAADLAALRVAYAVDFKRCMWHSTPEAYAEDRARAVARMAEYVDYLMKDELLTETN